MDVFFWILNTCDFLHFYDVGAADYQVFVDAIYWKKGTFLDCDKEAEYCAVGNNETEFSKIKHD